MASSDDLEFASRQDAYDQGYWAGHQHGWDECFELALVGYCIIVLIGIWVALT